MDQKDESCMISKIEEAVISTMKDEINNLKNGRVERNFTSYLATRIADKLCRDDLRVDPFCNKHLGLAKILDGKLIELDIAIHTRNVDNNLVAIEIETNNNPSGDDIPKLQKLTQDSYGYNYKLGFYVVFGVSERAGQIIQMKWYKNGLPI